MTKTRPDRLYTILMTNIIQNLVRFNNILKNVGFGLIMIIPNYRRSKSLKNQLCLN